MYILAGLLAYFRLDYFLNETPEQESRATLTCLYRTSGQFLHATTHGHALAPLVIGKDRGHLLFKSALHSFKFGQV